MSTRSCVWKPDALIVVMVSGYEPAVPASGVPAIVTTPALIDDVSPAGRVPAIDTVGVGIPLAEMVIAPLWPTRNTELPVMSTTVAGRVPVLDPGASQAETSPPYGSSVAPATVVPAGAVSGTDTPAVLVMVI